MAALPSNAVPTITPAEMQILVSRAGLVLNPGQVADLVLAWRQVAGLIAGLPQDRPPADDQAYAFRLPPPGTVSAARPAKRKAKAVAKKPAAPKKQSRAAKSAKPRRAVKPKARRGAASRR